MSYELLSARQSAMTSVLHRYARRETVLAVLAHLAVAASMVSGGVAHGAENSPSAASATLVKVPAGASAPATASASVRAGALPAGVVARVNGVAITQASLDQAVQASGSPDTPELRAALKSQLIARELVHQAALKAHFERRPEVVDAVEKVRNAVMDQVYVRTEMHAAPVTDSQVRAQYDTYVASLGKYEYQPSVIALRDAATAQSALERIRKGEDFATVARQLSVGPNAAQGGVVNWFSFTTPAQAEALQRAPVPLAEALMGLAAGQMTQQPVHAGELYWIVRLDQKRDTQVPKFDDVKAGIRAQLEQAEAQKADAALVSGLAGSAHIEQ